MCVNPLKQNSKLDYQDWQFQTKNKIPCTCVKIMDKIMVPKTIKLFNKYRKICHCLAFDSILSGHMERAKPTTTQRVFTMVVYK